jgi:hypothetical protein
MEMNHRGLKTGSQNSRILRYLALGHTLTPAQAYIRFDCLRLGGRILELRHRGHNIRTEMVELKNGKRVARYWMEAQ